MKQSIPQQMLIVLIFSFLISCQTSTKEKTSNPGDRLAKASRENKNGWVYVHLEGSPSDIGYQHGYLLSNEIDTTLQMMGYFLEHETKKDWAFYRQCAKNFLWDKLDPEYKAEINGIAEGLRAKQKNYDSLDITALNAMEELAYYYVPQFFHLLYNYLLQ